jgi:hypothetical protein
VKSSQFSCSTDCTAQIYMAGITYAYLNPDSELTHSHQLNLVLHFALRFHHNHAGTDRFR